MHSEEFDIEKSYQKIIEVLSHLKKDKRKLKIAYDFITQLKD